MSWNWLIWYTRDADFCVTDIFHTFVSRTVLCPLFNRNAFIVHKLCMWMNIQFGCFINRPREFLLAFDCPILVVACLLIVLLFIFYNT